MSSYDDALEGEEFGSDSSFNLDSSDEEKEEEHKGDEPPAPMPRNVEGFGTEYTFKSVLTSDCPLRLESADYFYTTSYLFPVVYPTVGEPQLIWKLRHYVGRLIISLETNLESTEYLKGSISLVRTFWNLLTQGTCSPTCLLPPFGLVPPTGRLCVY